MCKIVGLVTFLILNSFNLSLAEEFYLPESNPEMDPQPNENVCRFETSFYGTSRLTPYSRGDFDEATWALLQPYLLPIDHPIKNKLDEIFTKSRASTSIETLPKPVSSICP